MFKIPEGKFFLTTQLLKIIVVRTPAGKKPASVKRRERLAKQRRDAKYAPKLAAYKKRRAASLDPIVALRYE